jgi:eukaryotic-like serine/threonine-protein kinase
MPVRRCVLLVVLAVLALSAGVNPVGAATARLSLKPSSGPPTTTVKAAGSGFGPTESVTIVFDATQVASPTTSSSGSFSATFGVPAASPPGIHQVIATGQTSGLTATASFRVQTNWGKLRFDAANTGFNPFENVINIANVSGLTTAWSGETGSFIGDSPAVVNGVAYIGSANGIEAFGAAGMKSCSGSPKTCQPLWTGTTGYFVASTPAVANRVLYVSSEDGKLYAFDAAGVTNCSGTPKTCSPLWTSSDDVHVVSSSPAVVGGVVYVGAGTGGAGSLYAFDAKGVTNCSGTPKTCTPLWRGVTSGKTAASSSPAVAGGVVYIGSTDPFGGGFDAFDAAGVTNCSGTPKTCTPLWSATTGSFDESSPTVANGEVYVDSDGLTLYAFDAAGVTNCSGTPKKCDPLWTSATKTAISGPAVANGVLYVGSFNGVDAYDAAGVIECSGTPTRCSPLWTGTTGGFDSPYDPSVANGLVYAGSTVASAYAFDASGATNCSGTPKTCQPVWSGATGGTNVGSPAVVNGVVYASSADDNLYAFDLP